ncbi:U-box domain-containing protein 52-like isoform X4 [Canna indica]|uniref:U-box domain-containing protein 52-like isoform X4 n=1 Tax=Canna indica TaxID=4628 RepID=A0AAQ3K3A9_9LILI|nr:U-box domain-containing protein 52-like isoform X4 [Canna indica]
MRNAVRPPPMTVALRNQIQSQGNAKPETINQNPKNGMRVSSESALTPWNLKRDTESIKSPFTRGGNSSAAKSYGDLKLESDISFVSSGRPSLERSYPPRLSNHSDSSNHSFESPCYSAGAYSSGNGFSSLSHESSSSQCMHVMNGPPTSLSGYESSRSRQSGPSMP